MHRVRTLRGPAPTYSGKAEFIITDDLLALGSSKACQLKCTRKFERATDQELSLTCRRLRSAQIVHRSRRPRDTRTLSQLKDVKATA